MMSVFRVVKYSSLLFFLGKYKTKLFRVIAVLLFALITTLLYQDIVAYLQLKHPDTVIYALIAKIIIVYGSLAFVLWQFKPDKKAQAVPTLEAGNQSARASDMPADRLTRLNDIDKKVELGNRYQTILDEKKPS
ncbi:MAG: hypothetical protein ACJA09_003066 [Alcanivorax sp.]|jgi:hypothetical protein